MLPELFLDRMKEMLKGEYEEFLVSFDKPKYQALRLNALKKRENGESAAVLANAEDFPFSLKQVPWAENGYYYQNTDQPGKHPYHDAGLYYIQEPSAMAPVTLLEVKPGERILDLCAAPGGKSTQIAAALQGEGLLICNEIHPARAKILSENVERMGIRNACVTNETPAHLSQVFVEYFDRILVDAPCSGEGMFRKNEAACEEWSPENVALCAERQDEILDHAARMLRPGGRLVYSTCTFAPQENEGSINRFLKRNPDFTIVPIDKEELFQNLDLKGVCDGRPEWAGKPEQISASMLSDKSVQAVEPVLSDESEQPRASLVTDEFAQAVEHVRTNESVQAVEPVQAVAPMRTDEFVQADESVQDLSQTLRLWPHHLDGEGHYAAVLQKAGSVPEAYAPMAVGGIEKGLSLKELGEYPQFAKENLKISLEGKYVKFGDNIYLVPEDMPALKGLKVLRPGLHIGTLKKNRFEPSHALALAVSPAEAVHVWRLSSTEQTIAAYLNGQTYPAEGEKGWYLICVDGFSIGWGKLAGGIMKNHYPKGLRRNG